MMDCTNNLQQFHRFLSFGGGIFAMQRIDWGQNKLICKYQSYFARLFALSNKALSAHIPFELQGILNRKIR
jgi:hypothetical protein